MDAERSVDGILAGWAHDLGKPLQVIESMARRLVRETADNPRAGALARRIVSLSDDALLVVERLMSTDRAAPWTAGSRLALEAVIGRAVSVAAGLHPGARVRVCGPVPGVEVEEAGRLLSVLVNVVDNALRAAPGGDPVTIRARRRSGSPAEVAIVVADRGVGLAARRHGPDRGVGLAARRHRPDRGEPDGPSRLGRRGLGLAESRRQLAAMCGGMTCDSVAGVGTRVTIVLPIDPDGSASERRDVVSSRLRR